MYKDYENVNEKNYYQTPLVNDQSTPTENINKIPLQCQEYYNNNSNAPSSSYIHVQPNYPPSNINSFPPTNVVMNQTQLNNGFDNNLPFIPKNLRSETRFVQCPSCQHKGYTRIEKSCNICNALCCICGSILLQTLGAFCWAIFNAARDKDVNCYEAKHFCQNCGTKLVDYSPC